jgi:hypothetical protein
MICALAPSVTGITAFATMHWRIVSGSPARGTVRMVPVLKSEAWVLGSVLRTEIHLR